MKAVILAGGYGTRISEETHLKPKPMVEIGGKPILWHIMKTFSYHNVNDFIICCGYKGYIIKEYFANYFLHMSDVTFDIKNNKMKVHQQNVEPWTVTLIDTGQDTMTGGRLKKIYSYIKDEKDFFFTYGDGLSNINITNLLKFHKNHKKKATLTAVKQPGRYGAIIEADNKVTSFIEKPDGEGGLINGGYFVLKPEVIEYIENENTSWETSPLENLVKDQELMVYKHDGFWQAMDTLRDKNSLENLWINKKAPWKNWNE
ncbi:glucose-1-phosphate cytidylyltransferase [Alphaproteobacteria bacterium]|nr:glucose-1-phosphate cytidylyltransferase [Alphaproteobacteria bacterium]